MKHSLYLLLSAFLATGISAYADQITYTTTGTVFNCDSGDVGVTGCGTDTVTVGGVLKLTYLPGSASVTLFPVTAPSTFSNIGNVQVSCEDGTTSCAGQTLPLDLTLAIQINQTSPDNLSGAFPIGLASGLISGSASNANILFTPGASVTLNGTVSDVKYAVLSSTVPLTPPGTCFSGCGTTSIEAKITDFSAIPEPAVSLLCAVGLLAIGGIRRRDLRRK